MHGLAVLVAATISTLSLCKTRTEPAVTISDLSSVVLVSWYSDSSFFWMPAIPWSWAWTTDGSAASTARTPLRILIVFIESISLNPCVTVRLAVFASGKTCPIIHRPCSAGNAVGKEQKGTEGAEGLPCAFDPCVGAQACETSAQPKPRSAVAQNPFCSTRTKASPCFGRPSTIRQSN